MTITTSLRRLAALAAVAGLTAVGAHAGEGDTPPGGAPRGPGDGPRMRRPAPDPIARVLDADGDRALSAAELEGAPQALLKLDANKDGKLTRDEFAPRRRRGLADLDKDGDGKITKDEAGERAWQRLQRLDKNGDGVVDKEEIAAIRPRGPGAGRGGEGGGRRGGGLEQLDKNGDGKIAKDEVPEQLWQRLGRHDKNADGVIDKDEMAAVADRRRRGEGPGAGRQRRPTGSPFVAALDSDKDHELSADEIKNATASLKKLDKNGDGQLSGEEIAPPRRGRDLAALIKQHDKDGDGKLGMDEAPGRMLDNFERIDANGDGFIDKDELEQMMGRMREGRRGERRKKAEEK